MGIDHAVVCDLNGPYLQCLRVNTQVHLAPLAPILGTVLFAFPLPLAQELDACAVDQQIQRCAAALVRQLHLQCLLAAADGAEIWHVPIEPRQLHHALHRPQTLAKGQTEQALDAQAKLDGRIGEGVLATALATGRRVPWHVFVQPDSKRASFFKRCVVLCPVGGLVAALGYCGVNHALRLPAQRGALCNKAA